MLYAHTDTACHFTYEFCEVTMAIKKTTHSFPEKGAVLLESFLSLGTAVMKNGDRIMSYRWLISNLEVD